MRTFHRNAPGHACTLLFVGALAIASIADARAELRATEVCSDVFNRLNAPVGLPQTQLCYSGFNCRIGMRGDWLDVTTEVEFFKQAASLGTGSVFNASGSVEARGVDNNSPLCVPHTGSMREGYVLIRVVDIRGAGRMRVVAKRPGPMGVGTHSDAVDFEIRDGSHYLQPFPERELNARVGQTKVIEIAGEGVQDLQLKLQPVAQAYASASAARAPRLAAMTAGVRTSTSVQTLANMQGANTVRALGTTQSGTSPTPVTPPVATRPSTPAPATTSPEVTILGKTRLMVRLQVKFDRQGIFSLGDYLEFSAGDPAINRDLGWPVIDVKP